MDLLDWIIVLLLLASAIHGLRVGAAVQILSFAGALVGLVAGVALVTNLSPHLKDDLTRTFVSLLLLVVPCGLFAGIGRHLGTRLWGRIRGHRLARLDAAAGGALAMAGMLVFVWLLASVLVSSPVEEIASQIEGSKILAGVSQVMPPIPSELSSVDRILNRAGFPVVFESGPLARVRMPSSPFLAETVRRTGSSTVQVTAYGCDGGALVEKGSGFVAGAGLVITNAHVIAGSNRVVVQDEEGDHVAKPIYYNPRYDLAVLRVENLTDRPLALDPDYVARGTQAVVLGYPGGGPFDAQPAGVLSLLDATGYDIYGNALTTRDMYEIQSLVREGNSGGPLAEENGTVIGVVFSREAGNDTIGYALASPGVLARLKAAEREPASHVTPTGVCIAG